MPTRYTVVAFGLSAMAVAYLDRVCIAVAAPHIRSELALSDAQLGYVFSAFTLAYALFEMPSGYLADRFGARLMMARIVIWWSLLTALTGAAWSFFSLLVIRFLFGAGEAGVMPSLARAFGRWLPWSESARAFGLTVMAGAVSGALTQPLAAALFEGIGWRWGFVVFGLIGFVWVAAWLRWFRDDPEEHPRITEGELDWIRAHRVQPSVRPHWTAAFRQRDYGTICLAYFLAIYGWYFYITWLPSYLMRGRGFTALEAGALSALPLVSIAIGVALGGYLSDRISVGRGRSLGRRLPAVMGLAAAAVCLAASMRLAHPLAATVLLSLAAGFAALSVAPAWALCAELGGEDAGLMTGGMNMCGNLGGALSGVVVGWIQQWWDSWDGGLWSIVVAYLLAGTLWLVIHGDGTGAAASRMAPSEKRLANE